MDVVEYLKEKARMTNNCKYSCGECPLSSENNGINRGCAIFECKYPEKAIAIVEKWAKEHPVKTYLSALLEKFPDIPLNVSNLPKFCPGAIWKNANCIRDNGGSVNCTDCWNREYKEEK